MTTDLHIAADDIELAAAAEFAADLLDVTGEFHAQSVAKYRQLWRLFAKFATSFDMDLVGDINADVVRRFVAARTPDGAMPSVGTQHVRRSAIRLEWRVLRMVGVAVGDPTLDVTLPPRSPLSTRPLTDEEVDECRWAALATLTATRQPAVWALAEAGATTGEIAAVRAVDVHVADGTVDLPGTAKTDARTSPLTDWGQLQLRRRIDGCDDLAAPLVYGASGSPESQQSSVCSALARILERAGLAHEADVRPGSVRGWVGAQVLATSGRIEDVARALGLRSLDQAAAVVGFRWRDDP